MIINKRIALIYKDLALGGVQHKIVDITKELAKRKNVKVYLFLIKKEGEFLEKIPPQVNIINLHASLRLPFVFFLPLKLSFAIILFRPDVVFALMDTYGCSAILAKTMLLRKKPKIIISQNVYPYRFLKQRSHFWLRKLLITTLYPRASQIISLSDAITNNLVTYFNISRKKITLVRNWTKNKKNGSKTIDIIYAGRFAEEKNLPLLLESFSLLLTKRPKAVLCLLGYGKEEKNIRKIIAKLHLNDRVIIKGFTHNPSKMMQRSRILTITSYNEGTPQVILEAMAIGIPVITTNFPGVREMIIHKKSGIIANTPKSISAWMQKLLCDKKLTYKLTTNAKQFIKKNYPSSNLKKLVNIICQEE